MLAFVYRRNVQRACRRSVRFESVSKRQRDLSLSRPSKLLLFVRTVRRRRRVRLQPAIVHGTE